MVGKAGLKAGLIGTAVLLVMTAINQILPISGALVYVLCGFSTLIYAGIGVLAGFFLVPPRTPGRGAGAGAIAGVIGGVINGIVGAVIMVIRQAQGLGLAGLTPEQMQQLSAAGVDPTVYAIPGVICGMVVGAGAAAIGGAILAAVKSD